MNFSILISVIAIFGGIFSFITSIINFSLVKKEIKIKMQTANCDIELSKINLDKLDEYMYRSLKEECESIIGYFKKISLDNEYRVYIYKIIDGEYAKVIFSSFDLSCDEKCSVKENIEFSQTKRTKKPFFINNIPYFRKLENKYFNSNSDWNQFYQSHICCPIKDKNDAVIGFLFVEIMKPLNDLINIKNITDYLEQECKIIAINKEFSEYNPN